MELAYLCRLRGIEAVTLTDANELEEGLLTNCRKGGRDNVVRWTPPLRTAWDGAKAYRRRIWADKAYPYPVSAEGRFIIVAAHGGALQKSGLDTAWQRFITRAIEDGVISQEQRFALHDLKRRGITAPKRPQAEARCLRPRERVHARHLRLQLAGGGAGWNLTPSAACPSGLFEAYAANTRRSIASVSCSSRQW